VGKEAWARYGMNKARGMAQKTARFDAGVSDGRAAALAAEAGADRDALQRAATGAAWREAEAATDAARGEAERLTALVTPQPRSRALPWLALVCMLLLALAAWLAASAMVAGVAALGGVGALLVAIHGLRQPTRLPQVSREQRDDILQQAQAAAREAGLKAAWVAGWEQGWAAGWKERD